VCKKWSKVPSSTTVGDEIKSNGFKHGIVGFNVPFDTVQVISDTEKIVLQYQF